jgi:hypothetical protein
MSGPASEISLGVRRTVIGMMSMATTCMGPSPLARNSPQYLACWSKSHSIGTHVAAVNCRKRSTRSVVGTWSVLISLVIALASPATKSVCTETLRSIPKFYSRLEDRSEFAMGPAGSAVGPAGGARADGPGERGGRARGERPARPGNKGYRPTRRDRSEPRIESGSSSARSFLNSSSRGYICGSRPAGTRESLAR